MSESVVFGGSVIAAVIAGSVALFAPCCISVMLPAYFAGSFPNRRRLVAMTFVFAGGIATVILPIALGAQVLRRILIGQHTGIYVAMGLLLFGLGAYLLLGGKISLPMPGRRAGGRAGPMGVYSLGLFSGVASACCAPVLAGVIALSGIASSFGVALGLGSSYVFGMVAPLFVISLLWERYDWRSSRLFRPRSLAWRLGPIRRTVTGTNLASGLLLLLVGSATVWIGLAGQVMPEPGGWQARVSARLQHYSKVLTDWLSWLPAWAGVVVVLVVMALLVRRAMRQVRAESESELDANPQDGGDLLPPSEERLVAHEERGATR